MPAITPGAAAAELDGVRMPDAIAMHGVALRLNGMGVRTFSFLGIRIYVAGLYLERPSRDADAILRSPETKLLRLHFVHRVSAGQARDAWRDGFAANCRTPCQLAEAPVRQFLAGVADVGDGDETMLGFTGDTVQVSLNGRPTASVTDAALSHAVLATFIGASPPSERLKQGLLGIQK